MIPKFGFGFIPAVNIFNRTSPFRMIRNALRVRGYGQFVLTKKHLVPFIQTRMASEEGPLPALRYADVSLPHHSAEAQLT